MSKDGGDKSEFVDGDGVDIAVVKVVNAMAVMNTKLANLALKMAVEAVKSVNRKKGRKIRPRKENLCML